MAVTRTSVGTPVNGISTINPKPGVGAVAGDFGLIVVETANQDPGGITGWTNIASGGFGTGGAAGSTLLTAEYKPSISSTDISTGPTVLDSGDHQLAVMVTYSGLDATTPVVFSSVSFNGTTTSTSVTTSSVALSTANVKNGDIVLCCIVTDRDSNTAATITSPAWVGCTGSRSNLVNTSTATASGGGIIIDEFVPSADATGSVSFSCTITASAWVAFLVVLKASASTRSATLSKTLSTVTLSDTANLLLKGSLSKTLNTVTLTDTANLLLKGSLSKTLNTVTLTDTANLLLKGSLSKTLGVLTGTETGQLIIKGSLGKTLGVVTVSSSGNVHLTGSLSKSLTALGSSSTGKILIKGSLGQTLGVLSGSETAVLLIKGLLSTTLNPLSVVVTSNHGHSGSVAIQLAPVTVLTQTRLVYRLNIRVVPGRMSGVISQIKKAKRRRV